jgi:hypothetical protein
MALVKVNLTKYQATKVILLNCHAMKTNWMSGGIAPSFLTSALYGGEWSASRPGQFKPGVRDSGAHRIGGSVGPIAGLGAIGKEKISIIILLATEFHPVVPPAAHSP